MEKRKMDKCLSEMQKTGSEEAFEQLYNESKKGVFSFIYSFVSNYYDAEDIMQQTFINVKLNADKYVLGTNALAWILEIAKNLSLNFLKKNKNELVFTDAENAVSNISVENPETEGEILGIINSHLEKEDRQIVIMHLVSGLKHREIAKQLNIPLGTVLWKYNKSIKSIKNIIEKEYYEN